MTFPMGLDKGFGECLNGYTSMKPLGQLGYGNRSTFSVWGYLSGIFHKPKRLSPVAAEREQFAEDVKEQFLQLQKKGISIPIFTL